MSVKTLYAGALHRLRASRAGQQLMRMVESCRECRVCAWLRSLFAIYDFDDLVRLGLPWWTFDSIDVVERFLAEKGTARVFEYGAGASTLWLAARSAEVISIEHDLDWAEKVRAKVWPVARCTVHAIAPVPQHDGDNDFRSNRKGFEKFSFRDYVNAIRATECTFDPIVIDGRCREQCLVMSMEKLAADGIILFDDTLHKRYRTAIRATPLYRRAFFGLSVCIPYPDSTTTLSIGSSTGQSIPAVA